MTTESSEDEWEEVEESQKLEDVKPVNNVEVELELSDVLKKKKKKADREREEIETCIRRAAKRYNKEVQISTHKTHLLCLFTLGMRLNRLCNDQELQSLAYSWLPIQFAEKNPKDISVIFLTRMLQSVTKIFTMKNGSENLHGFGIFRINRLRKILAKNIEAHEVNFKLDLVLIFIMMFRAMGFTCRLVMSLQPTSLKILTEKQKESQANKRGEKKNVSRVSNNSKKRQLEKISQVDGANDNPSGRVTRSRSKVQKLEKTSVTKADKQSKKTANAKSQSLSLKRELKTESIIGNHGDKENKTVVNNNVIVKVEKLQPKDQNNNETPIRKTLSESKAKRSLRPPSRQSLSKKQMIKQDRSDDDDKNFQPVASSDSGSDFEVEEKKTKKRRRNTINNPTTVTRTPKGAVSGSVKSPMRKQQGNNNRHFFDEWIEVFFEQENKWFSVDVFRCAINHPEMMEKYATPDVHYAIGYENDGSVKDVTARYASKWLTETRKLRVGIVDKDWWKTTLAPYATKNLIRDKAENAALQEALLAQPIPTTISAFKNHPLFGLRRHLLKFEAIYPPDVPAVGLIRGEEIFPRSAIYTLHTRDKWLQEARSVKDGEEPYKMVASLWINMKLKQDMATLSMPLFGIWQTEPFVPAVAKDGKVPRNQYGNVDLFQPSMMPIGCVQLRLAGLSRVARKLNIDIAEAITGFDSHAGYPHPVTDGYVVCKEHEEVLVAAWREDQIHAAEREQKKREQRIYSLWKQIIKGVLALERVKRKYAVRKDAKSPKGKGSAVSKESTTSWQAKRLEEAKRKSGRRGRPRKEDNLFPFEMGQAYS